MSGKTWRWMIAALVLVLLALPHFFKGYYIYVINLVGIYVLIALGLNLLTGYCGQLSLGHAAFFAMGSFTSAFLTSKGLSFWVGLPTAGFAAGGLAFLVGIPVLRLRLIFLAIATVGLGIITHDVLYNLNGFTGGADGMVVPKPTLGPWVFKDDGSFFYIIAGVVLFLSILIWNISRTRAGRAFLAIRESERAATAAGIDVPRV